MECAVQFARYVYMVVNRNKTQCVLLLISPIDNYTVSSPRATRE